MENNITKLSEKKQAFLLKRKELISLSQAARELVTEGEYNTINEALVDQYKENNPDIKVFNTFNQWKKLGYTIIKGSKSFLVWGQPKHVQQTTEGSGEPEEFKYWPVCFLFANTQVIKPESETHTNIERVEIMEEALPV
jgi:hypothetical protein